MSSSTNKPAASSSTGGPWATEKSFFEQQRDVLLQEIGIVSAVAATCECLELTRVKSFEHVLANINKLNRSLEGVIAVRNTLILIVHLKELMWLAHLQVGNEFSSVEALWSQFENVMAKDPDAEGQAPDDEDGEERGREDETEPQPENEAGR